MSWLRIEASLVFLPLQSGSDGWVYKPCDSREPGSSSAADHDSHAHSIDLAGGDGIDHSSQAGGSQNVLGNDRLRHVLLPDDLGKLVMHPWRNDPDNLTAYWFAHDVLRVVIDASCEKADQSVGP